MTLVNMFTFNRKVNFSIISKCLSSKSPSVKSNPKTVVKATSTRKTFFNQESPDMKKVYDISDKITIVRDRSKAESVLKVLYDSKNVIWGCDTEVADIDVKTQGPVGNGKVICVSIYGGPRIDFGDGPGSALWIENIGEAEGILNMFKPWFEDDNYKKVWHNYGFDRHVMNNENINCKGFYGDTMHMARLWDTSRDKATGGGGGEGYSLESLSSELIKNPKFTKTSMKDLFGISKSLKNGEPSKVKEIPPVRDLQLSPIHRDRWIQYSALDAIATWCVREQLEARLKKMPWYVEDSRLLGNMYDYYLEYLLPFGELLTEMEQNGIKVDTAGHLKEAEKRAKEEKQKMELLFRAWLNKYSEEAKYINTASASQMQQLFFGHYENHVLISETRTFRSDKSEEEYEEENKIIKDINPYVGLGVDELKSMLKSRNLKRSGKKSELMNRLQTDDILRQKFDSMNMEELLDVAISKGISDKGTKEELIDRIKADELFLMESDSIIEKKVLEKPKKYREFSITSLKLRPDSFTPTGIPQVSASVLKKMAGSNLFGDPKDAVWGTAYHYFGGGEKGEEACRAIGALAAIGQIDATIQNFLLPLQSLVDSNSRIHCSLNLNTETGRLSSRKPNLQNQPALEKDQYKIRDAFIAEPGKTLIVADYGQLELRLLAHIAGCKSMIDAFKSGGCFHSRTAVGMYPYIKEAVESGKVMLEWDYSKGQPTVPLVKDTYGSERRKAKTLNFSIAYGKTVFGLAADWGISTEEAEETLAAWYRDRPEVQEWQEKTRKLAKEIECVRTLMGRYRRLPEARGRGPAAGHALRAAINTPIQGSAADIVIVAMLKLWRSEKLKSLGWKLLLQIHDEVILEGPIESKDEALEEVRKCMEHPYDGHGLSALSVSLDVDAKSADSWYKAK